MPASEPLRSYGQDFSSLSRLSPRAGHNEAETTRIALETPLALFGLGVAATFAYAGHGFTGRWPVVGFALDTAHVTAASIWLGGLVLLAVAVRRHTDARDSARALGRFSRIALPAIAVVVLSGVLQGWRQIGTWSAFWHTSYGRLLLIKVLVVVAIVIVASAGRTPCAIGDSPMVRTTTAPRLRAPAALSARSPTGRCRPTGACCGRRPRGSYERHRCARHAARSGRPARTRPAQRDAGGGRSRRRRPGRHIGSGRDPAIPRGRGRSQDATGTDGAPRRQREDRSATRSRCNPRWSVRTGSLSIRI